MNLKDVFTITGMSLTQAVKELDSQLPAEAYTAIQGGPGQKAGLTDIKPAYMFSEVNRIFGPLGTGWCYTVKQIHEEQVDRLRQDGSAYTEWVCGVYVEVQYLTVHKTPEEERTIQSMPIPAEGGSSNLVYEWALKGAETNALGAAWSRVGWQDSVYKGIRSHNKVTEEPPAAAESMTPQEARGRRRKAAEPEAPQEPAPTGRKSPQPAPGLEEATALSVVEYMKFVLEQGATQAAVDKQLNLTRDKYGGIIPQVWVDHMMEQAKLKARMKEAE